MAARTAARSAGFVDFELVAWESFDGTRIPGWLALPRSPQPAGGYPAIIWVHGGPVGQARPNFRPDIQMLLAQGFAVLLPNVRGSSGYGRAYTESDDVERRLDSVTDLAHGRHWLAAHPAIDAERIGIMGQSYGGFMVMSAITEHPELWRAAVNYYGIADFVTLLAGTGAWRRSHRAAEYGDPERDAALFARISPIHRVDRIAAPVLIAHGTRDPRVPIGESEQFVTALQERQKKVTYRNLRLCRPWFHPPRRQAPHLPRRRGLLRHASALNWNRRMYLPARNHRVLIMGRNGAVGANHPLATQAGLDTLRAGGNAVDASVAISLTLGVVEPGMSGLGGDGFYQVYTARDATSRCYNATGAAPLAATPERFRAARHRGAWPAQRLHARPARRHRRDARRTWAGCPGGSCAARRSSMRAKALPSRITTGTSPAMCARCSPPMRVRAACS